MSDILINGMEMPKSTILFCIHPDGKVFVDLEGKWREYKAIPISAHGRLIDADALVRDNGIKEIPEYYEVVCDAPTIIPAEEEP